MDGTRLGSSPLTQQWFNHILIGCTLIAHQISSNESLAVDLLESDSNAYRCCGLNCLYVISKLKDIPVSRADLERNLSPRDNGDTSVADIERASVALGLDPVSARIDLTTLAQVPLPAIVQLKSRTRQSSASHYVVLLSLHREGVITVDPPIEASLHPYSEFARDWTGVTIAFPADSTRKSALIVRLNRAGRPGVWVRRLVIVVLLALLAWSLLARRRQGPTAKLVP